jgi:hypothetical protein
MAVKKIKKIPTKKMSKSQRKRLAKRNKQAGSTHERDEVNRHKRYFSDVVTTRYANQARDGDGIDLCNQHEDKFGRLPFEVSCKTSIGSIPYMSILEGMDGPGTRIVQFRKTGKSEEGRFMVKGEYTMMYRQGYEQFLQHVYAIQVLRLRQPELIQKLEEEFKLQLLDVPQQIQIEYKENPEINDSTH